MNECFVERLKNRPIIKNLLSNKNERFQLCLQQYSVHRFVVVLIKYLFYLYRIIESRCRETTLMKI